MGRMRGMVGLVWLLAMLLAAPGWAWAHSMFQSSVLLDYHAGTIDAELQMPPSRLEKVFGRAIDASTLATLEPELRMYLLQRVHVESADGRAWEIALHGPIGLESVDGAPYVVAHLILTPPRGGQVRTLTLEDDVITDSVPNHVVLVSVRSDWDNRTFANDPELIGVLHGEQRSILIERGAGSWTRGFGSVFRLGLRHIAEGTDHLLFLLALLLPAPLLYVAGRWGPFGGVQYGLVKILNVVTAFTVGHSLTLALAASGLVQVPERPVEVLIAVSILASAMHALRPLFPGREPLIAASFGLIHGLAFASTLAELGLHRWERVESILAFNLGIETMQLVVVAAVMPALMILSRTPLYPPFRIAGAAFAGIAAAGWIVERTWNLELHVDRVVDGLAKHPALLIGVLYSVALLAEVWRRARRGKPRIAA